ncbi:MAG: hypothetical protein LCH90_23205 [Proteobacteria bacterium]|nr:hypothetical protein [Pseudomonadota bacterium]
MAAKASRQEDEKAPPVDIDQLRRDFKFVMSYLRNAGHLSQMEFEREWKVRGEEIQALISRQAPDLRLMAAGYRVEAARIEADIESSKKINADPSLSTKI